MAHIFFCVECRKEAEYEIRISKYFHSIKGKEYNFKITEALCKECGEKINLPGLMDQNAKEIDEQYRQIKDLVSVEDIEALMNIYNIGKAPLSLALGFGEITITRYLNGQYPSEEYSSIIRKALSSPDYMMECLDKYRNKIANTAYVKSYEAALQLKKILNSVSEKMLITISYIFEKTNEVTPLALQKLLYYIQALYMISYGKPLFDEECQAWLHGPVYEAVYNIFKNFKYNPIDDRRFYIFKNKFQKLSEDEKRIIDLVLDSFGMYSGKTLEKLTHKEAPWSEAFNDVCICGYTNEIISKESIYNYFKEVSNSFNLNTESGINQYIRKQLDC